jgi:predicted helicase
MAPYAIGHLKIFYVFKDMGVTLKEDDRFKLYITNTLDMTDIEQTNLPGMITLSKESRLAGEIKKQTPILVILGNPPYSGKSQNPSEMYITRPSKRKKVKKDIMVKVRTWIGEQIEYYKKIDGKSIGEKNPKWLQDDYVKFIRFSQWKIDKNGEGVLGFITNHGYLDNATFRGMRNSLMKSFNEIYILDLHGNIKKKEKCPDGSRDENVFNVKQGVAIALFIKNRNSENNCKVFHSELWGLRIDKYEHLSENDINSIEWKEITPKSEFYLFIPKDDTLEENYNKFFKITDILPLNSVGIVTARDKLTIQWTSEEVYRTVHSFSKKEPEEARLIYNLGPDARDWKVAFAQKDLLDSGLKRENIIPILYRPFDIRHTYYTGNSRGFHCMPRGKVMKNMRKENLALITNRFVNDDFKHVLSTNMIINDCTVSLETKERSYLFPLYLYPNIEKKICFQILKKMILSQILIQKFIILFHRYCRIKDPRQKRCFIISMRFSIPISTVKNMWNF